MANKDEEPEIVGRVAEQRVDISSSESELRKGVNVLNTSDPSNPAVNPFVQSQNQNASQGTAEQSTSNQQNAKNSE